MLLYGSNQAVLNFGAGIIFMVQDTKLRMTSFSVKIELSFFVFIEVYTPTDQFLYLCGSFTYDFFYSGTVTDPVTGNHCIFNMFFKIVYQQIGH